MGINLDVASFLDNLDRLFAEDYQPTFEDIVHLAPKAQTGISVTDMETDTLNYRFLDCNDQPSKRKWLHQFENALCLIYVVKLDEYDQFNDEGVVSQYLTPWHCLKIEMESRVIG